jgi:uncharacterized protein (TIGR03435 family)
MTRPSGLAMMVRDPHTAGRAGRRRPGLDGVYDFELKWSGDQVSSPPPAAAAAAPSLFTALQEQPGLPLTGERGPVDVLVIDRIEEARDS